MINIPKNCPACSSELIRINNQLFCDNKECDAKKSKKVEKFTKTMRILGLGSQTLKKLAIDNILDIYNLDETVVREVLGDKVAAKLLEMIGKSQTISLSTFLQSMSIPLIGKVAAEKIAKLHACLDDITYDSLINAGLGPKAADNFIKWLDEEWFAGLNTIPIKFESNNNNPSKPNTVVCISGKTPGYTKAQLADYLAKFNVNVESSVTSNVQYLISENTTTAKAKKAESLGIPIMSLAEFIKEILKNEPKVE